MEQHDIAGVGISIEKPIHKDLFSVDPHEPRLTVTKLTSDNGLEKHCAKKPSSDLPMQMPKASASTQSCTNLGEELFWASKLRWLPFSQSEGDCHFCQSQPSLPHHLRYPVTAPSAPANWYHLLHARVASSSKHSHASGQSAPKRWGKGMDQNYEAFKQQNRFKVKSNYIVINLPTCLPACLSIYLSIAQRHQQSEMYPVYVHSCVIILCVRACVRECVCVSVCLSVCVCAYICIYVNVITIKYGI